MSLSNLKERARNSLKGNWLLAIVASIIASIFGSNGGGNVNFTFDQSDLESLEGTDFSVFIEEHLVEVLAFVSTFALIGLVVSVVMFCLGSIVRVGYYKFNLDLVDNRRINIGTLFSYFKNWKNLILTNLLQTLYIFLWTLLCIIPGIVAEYKYAMTPYILAENPDLSPQQALDKSAKIMNGYKWTLFCLELSFIGWGILCILTCGIGYIWLSPYVAASRAEFYRQVSFTKASFEDEPSVDAWANN